MPERFPIQIAACDTMYPYGHYRKRVLHVLCSDGTVWRLAVDGCNWVQLPTNTIPHDWPKPDKASKE